MAGAIRWRCHISGGIISAFMLLTASAPLAQAADEPTYESVSLISRGSVVMSGTSLGAYTRANMYNAFQGYVGTSNRLQESLSLGIFSPLLNTGTVSYPSSQSFSTSPVKIVFPLQIHTVSITGDGTMPSEADVAALGSVFTADTVTSLNLTYNANGTTRYTYGMTGTTDTGMPLSITVAGLLTDGGTSFSTLTESVVLRTSVGSSINFVVTMRTTANLLKSIQPINSGFNIDYSITPNFSGSAGPILIPVSMVNSGLTAGSVVLTNNSNVSDASFVFTKDQAYTGGTTVSPGVTLYVPKGVTFGSGGIVNSGQMVFGVPSVDLGLDLAVSDFSFGDAMSGGGTISKVSSNTVTFTGNSSAFTGATTVSAGTLAVDGALGGSLTVNNGATLAGVGSVGNVTVQRGGTHVPGTRQTVNGDYTLAAGSTLAIGVGPHQASQVAVTSGAVSLGGSNLTLNALSGGPVTARPVYTIIDNQGSGAINGTFASINNNLAFYGASLTYTGGTGNDVVLTLERNATSYTDVAATSNQRGVAGQVAGLTGSDGYTIRDNILGLSAGAAQNAYQQLAGTIYPSTLQFNLNLGQQTGQQVSGHLAGLRAQGGAPSQRGLTQSAAQLAGFTGASAESSLGVAPSSLGISQANWGSETATGTTTQSVNGAWGQAMGGFSRQDGDDNAASTRSDWAGWVMGYDHAVATDTTLGGYVGYVRGNAKQDSVASSLKTDSVLLGLYGEYRLDGWRLDGQVGWSRIAADSSRSLSFGGISRTAQASYADQGLSVDLEAAHAIEVEKDVWLEPYAGVGATRQYLDDFTETGADAANLHRDADHRVTGKTRLGTRFSTRMDLGEGMSLMPQASLGWQHLVGPGSNQTMLRFANSSGGDFAVTSTDSARDTLTVSLGGTVLSGDGWQGYASYMPSVSKDLVEHSFVLGARVEW